MQNLDMRTLCDGMMRVRGNAAALLEDAKLLRGNDRTPRAYSLAYMACEEAGKLSILIGAAIQVTLGIPVDWKNTRKRFRSHKSKASQFLGLARVIPVIRAAAANGQKTVDFEDLMIKAAAGVMIGPALFTNRNASIYCDFEENSFTSPGDHVDRKMADQMIEFAEQHVAAANLILGNSVEETVKRIAAGASRERYDSIMSRAAEAAEMAEMALSMMRKKQQA